MTDTKRPDRGDHKDRNALDDTLPGRVVQAGLGGAYIAVPDYLPTAPGLIIARAGVLSTLVGLIATLNARRDAGTPETAAESGAPAAGNPEDEAAGPLKTWGFMALGAGALAGVLWADHRINLAMAKRLRRRGVRHPHTVFGVISAGMIFAISQRQR